MKVENQTSGETLINPLTNRPIRRVQLQSKLEVKPDVEKKKRGRPRSTSAKAEKKVKSEPKITKNKKHKYNCNTYEEYRRPRRSYPGQKLPCPISGCDRIFLLRLSLIRHLAYECKIAPPFKCGLCDLRAHYYSSIERHSKKVHVGIEPKVLELQNDVFVELEKDHDQKFTLDTMRELIAKRKPELFGCEKFCALTVKRP